MASAVIQFECAVKTNLSVGLLLVVQQWLLAGGMREGSFELREGGRGNCMMGSRVITAFQLILLR